MILLALVTAALATDAFDPTQPAERFEGRETWTQPEDIRLWNAVERWEDREPGLFVQEAFNDGVAWSDTDYTPWIATAFGSSTPHSSQFLLHVGLHEETAEGTPVLMVPGAGDNASRGFVTLATKLDRTNRPVFAMTFAHPHGDVFLHAEAVADAVAVIKERTGAEQVDVVAHSKGGIAATVYASHHAGADWGRDDYATHGTAYRGDIRRLVLVAVPLGGVDTSYRWSSLNYYSLDADTAVSPSSWSTYYPNSPAVPATSEDLSDQDMLPDGADVFPGQRQLLSRLDDRFPLPGSQQWLGVYALQQDWATTYDGGFGFVSHSEGIDAAIEAGGDLIARLQTVGVDPDIELFLLAGTSPIMPNGDDDLARQFDSISQFVDYEELMEEATARGIPMSADADELAGLEGGQLVLGELTGSSDGLVFVDSALNASALDARGALVVESRTANLSHIDLLYASPITGQLLVDAADAGGPDDQWARGVGKRYTSEDTLGWMEAVLADPSTPDTATDTGLTTGERPVVGSDTPGDFARPCGGCSSSTAPGSVLGIALVALGLVRRRR
jgi:pimeloyl-ACP methyl ester carboxylesterase